MIYFNEQTTISMLTCMCIFCGFVCLGTWIKYSLVGHSTALINNSTTSIKGKQSIHLSRCTSIGQSRLHKRSRLCHFAQHLYQYFWEIQFSEKAVWLLTVWLTEWSVLFSVLLLRAIRLALRVPPVRVQALSHSSLSTSSPMVSL